MRLSIIGNRLKNRIENRLKGGSSILGHNWNGTSIRRDVLQQVQPIMNFTHTYRPLASEVLHKTKIGQKDKTTRTLLGKLTDR